jgi:abequosyltransferase
MKLLSLCIPTYNRAKFLEESLLAIVNSIPLEHQTDLEIVISDNASTDGTQLVIQDFQKQFPNLTWVVVQQQPNIGPSNVVIVTNYASGEFIWILSDDDLVLPNAITNIMRILLNNDQINGIIVNYAGFQNNANHLEKPVLANRNLIFNKNDALRHLVTSLTFISVLIYRKRNTVIDEKFLHNSLPQSFIFLEALQSNEIYCTSEIMLAMRIGNSGGYDFYEVFLTTFNHVLDYAATLGFEEDTIQFVRKKHLRNHVTVFSIILKSNVSYGSLKFDNKLASDLVLDFNKKDFYAKILAFYIKTPNFFSVYINHIRLIRRKVLNLIHKV